MYQIYQVLPGDDLQKIASMFNTTTDNLIAINGLNFPVTLVPGNYIVVPKTENEYFQTYVVKKGDNLYAIAEQWGTDVVTIELLNGLKNGEYIYPNQELLVPSVDVSVYVTTEETLEDISNQTGVSIGEITEQNKQLYVVPDQILIYKKPKNE